MSTEPGTLETRSLDDIRPYWRNPRVIPESAVKAVADSITRYGYRNPIMVDGAGVIINGHTRYAALRHLGVDEAAVLVVNDLSPEKVREYRILDNKTGELSEWDHSALILELQEIEDESIADTYFPELDLEISDEIVIQDSEPEVKPISDAGGKKSAKVVDVTEVTCPSCFESFEVDTSSL